MTPTVDRKKKDWSENQGLKSNSVRVTDVGEVLPLARLPRQMYSLPFVVHDTRGLGDPSQSLVVVPSHQYLAVETSSLRKTKVLVGRKRNPLKGRSILAALMRKVRVDGCSTAYQSTQSWSLNPTHVRYVVNLRHMRQCQCWLHYCNK